MSQARGAGSRSPLEPPDSPEEGEVLQVSPTSKERKGYDGEDDDDDDEKTEEDHDNSSPEDVSSTDYERGNQPRKTVVKEKLKEDRRSDSKVRKKGNENVDGQAGIDAPPNDMEEDYDDEEEPVLRHKVEEVEPLVDREKEKILGLKVNSKIDIRDVAKERDSGQKTSEGSTVPVAAKGSVAVTSTMATVRESFLSDSLTEEERRTRTRYIPAVEGMHALRKHEIKRDLLLARTTPGISSSTSSKGIKSKQKSTFLRDSPSEDIATEEIDNDEIDEFTHARADAMDDDQRSSNEGKPDARRIQVGRSLELTLPSTVFRAPPPEENWDSEMDSKGDEGNRKRRSPGEVESITAFNPPRLPESGSAKKKHRTLRWQRRPADMDVDLRNYQKAVQSIREELRQVETEYQRIQTIDNHLRRHFLLHIKCLNEEMAFVNKELAAEQHKCLKATEWYLPTSRTRGRNDGKTGSRAMKDIIHGLRRLDVELRNSREFLQRIINETSKQRPGVGGVSGESFLEWNRSTNIEPCKFAGSWIVPNDIVILPKLGSITGRVVKFFSYTPLDVNEVPPKELFPKNHSKKTAPKLDSNVEVKKAGRSTYRNPFTTRKEKREESNVIEEQLHPFSLLLCPRFAVQLPFGVGFFSVDSVVSREDSSTYTNDRLAERWQGLIETATAVCPALDVGAMVNKTASEVSAAIQEYEKPLKSDDIRDPVRVDDGLQREVICRRLVPFGSGMIPTAAARGTLLETSTMAELNKGGMKLFYREKEILGNRNHLGVTADVRVVEDHNQEYLILQATVLQLRNQLYRQRRIRILNEKTYNATKERASRVESLVTEMRTDLKMLKARLDDEIRELGISEETAESILTAYYSSLDFQNMGDNAPDRRTKSAQAEDEVGVESDKMNLEAIEV